MLVNVAEGKGKIDFANDYFSNYFFKGVHSRCLELLNHLHLYLFAGSVLGKFCHSVLY